MMTDFYSTKTLTSKTKQLECLVDLGVLILCPTLVATSMRSQNKRQQIENVIKVFLEYKL